MLTFLEIQEFSKNSSMNNIPSRIHSPKVELFSNKVASFYFKSLKMDFEKASLHKQARSLLFFFPVWIPFCIHFENTRIVTLGQMNYSST